MQPPPQRKGKLVQVLRNVQTEQFSKLQQRYQLQIDLLEDVRAYMKQKSSIERDYAQALQKLNAQYIQKRDYSVEDESDQNLRSPLKVWKSYLDQMEEMAKRRVTVAEKAQTDVADKIKTVKSTKMTTFKKCQDLFQRIYEELNLSLREMSKCRKAYMELQKLAEIAQKETGDAQDKLKKGETFFKSKATLEKNFSKSSERRDLSVKQANASRNEYLLSLAALNGHMKRFREVDLTQILKDLDADFYEQMKEYHMSASVMEVEACLYGQDNFNSVISVAGQIDRDSSIRYFLEKNAMFQNQTTYAFEPYGEDKISTITTDSTVALAVDKEARKLATKYVREQRSLKNKFSKLSELESKQPEASAPADGQESELTVEGLQEAIRKVETAIEKTEAALALLRHSGVKVDDWIKSAEAQLPPETKVKPAQSKSATPVKADAGEYVDVYEPPPEANTSEDYWDDFEDTIYDKDDDEASVASGHVFSSPVPAVVLYDYTAASADELSIVENEEVEVLEKDGEGWCKGRNRNGQIGYFPESYVQISASPPSTISGANSVPDNLSQDIVMATEVTQNEHQTICIARALFDYSGQNDEELTFEEGAVINILRKDDGDVDDGWWEGEYNGKIGVFPSLLVEELDDQSQGTEEEQQHYFLPSHVYSEENRTRNLYGTLPRHVQAEASHEQNVCDSLDLTVTRTPPTRPRLPQHLLQQNAQRSNSYERNEYV